MHKVALVMLALIYDLDDFPPDVDVDEYARRQFVDSVNTLDNDGDLVKYLEVEILDPDEAVPFEVSDAVQDQD